MPGVSRRGVAVDVAGLLVVPAALVAVFLVVPRSVQWSLAFDHGAPEPHTLLTAAYVHATPLHLYSNVVAYVVAAGFTHWLSLASDARGWFWRTVPVFLTVLPVLVNLTDWLVFAVWYPAWSLRALGFSGVAAGFGGMLLVALARFVGRRFDRALGRTVGVATCLLALQVAAVRYGGGAAPYVTGLVVGGLLVLGVWYASRRERPVVGRPLSREAVQSAAVVVLILFVLAAVVLALFPRPDAVARGGVLTGVVAHAAGFAWGIVLSWATGRPTRP
jgi:hypothetical protein